MATFATAQTPVDDRAMVAAIKNAQPVRWDNLDAGTVDSMPVQVVRFRGGADSVDVFIAAFPRVDSILASAATTGRVLNSFWLLTGNAAVAHYDTARLTAGAVRTWTRRLAPGGYVYRIEATLPTSSRSARATSTVVADTDPRSGFSRTGFGLSDLLLATATEPLPGAAVRWNSVRLTALAGSVPRGAELSVIWENYGFGVDNGAARYTTVLTILRDRSGAGRIAARVLGALAGVARIETTDDRFVISLDRNVPHAAAFADQVTIGLADTPPGSYTMNLEVTDTVSGRKTSRAVTFRIAN
jgi:hypothetical protein